MSEEGKLSPKEIDKKKELFISVEQRAYEDHDKAVLALSGGALGISFTFVKTFTAGAKIIYPKLLVIAWGFWTASLTSILLSLYV